jgi:hypothetical protein
LVTEGGETIRKVPMQAGNSNRENLEFVSTLQLRSQTSGAEAQTHSATIRHGWKPCPSTVLPAVFCEDGAAGLLQRSLLLGLGCSQIIRRESSRLQDLKLNLA